MANSISSQVLFDPAGVIPSNLSQNIASAIQKFQDMVDLGSDDPVDSLFTAASTIVGNSPNANTYFYSGDVPAPAGSGSLTGFSYVVPTTLGRETYYWTNIDGNQTVPQIFDTLLHEFVGRLLENDLPDGFNSKSYGLQENQNVYTEYNELEALVVALDNNILNSLNGISYGFAPNGQSESVARFFQNPNLLLNKSGGVTYNNINWAAVKNQLYSDWANSVYNPLSKPTPPQQQSTNVFDQGVTIGHNAENDSGYDPLIIDLGSGGVQLTSLQNGVQFDLQDTGFTQQTAWLANSNEGFLVVDPNNDAITNGSQLLGQNTVLPNGTIASSGFQALDELSDAQTQQSGVLTDSDPLFDELRIYENNGTLLTLQQAGIMSINLTPENTDVTDQYGNQQLDIGSFTFVNGNTGFMGDYALVHDTQLSTTESTLPVSAAVAALPNVPGSGIIPSLQQAMMHDTTGNLQSLVEQFIASTDPTTQSSILDEIMTAWAGAPNSDVQPDEHITVVENLMGETFTNAGPAVTGNSLGIAVEGAYQLFKESTWAQLMVQSQLSSLFSQITTSVDPDTGITTYDFSGLIQSLQNELQSNYTQGVQDLANSYRAIVDLGMDQNSNFATFYSAFSSNSTLKFAMDTAGKEAYFSATGFTGSIDNTITPNLYIDLTANDYSGPVFAGIDDVIFFDKNNGPVSLEEGNDETIVLGSDVSSNDVYFTSNDDVEVVMHFFDSNATLTLGAGVTDYGWTNQSASQQITAIQFVDGTQITGNDLLNDISAYANQNQDLNRVGITINETDYASGNDSVYAGSGQDTVVGGTGTESLYAGSGQDTLIAGTGNTTMYGGAGTDTFVFGPGNGVASIIEPTTSSAKSDLLEVNDTLTDTTFTESGNNLILTLASGDQIMLQNELTQQDVQEFSFSDGNVLALSDIESGLVTLNAPSGQSTFIAPDNSYIIQGTGNETIFTNDGNDTVYGNGNSTINLGAGTDTVDAGPGVSTISGGDGNAAIIFNQGDGQQTLNLNGNNNLISFGAGITASDLLLSAQGSNLVVGFANSNDEIVVDGQFVNPSVSEFNFSDGSQLTWQSALQGIEIAGTAPGDTINDTLSTTNDIIQGAGGNETILLGAGNDTVIAGQGNTAPTSGNGSDIIVFQAGDGQLTINESDSGTGTDTLVLGQGLTASDVVFSESGNKLVLSSGTEHIVPENALGSSKEVSSIVFGDGTTLSLSETIDSVTSASFAKEHGACAHRYSGHCSNLQQSQATVELPRMSRYLAPRGEGAQTRQCCMKIRYLAKIVAIILTVLLPPSALPVYAFSPFPLLTSDEAIGLRLPLSGLNSTRHEADGCWNQLCHQALVQNPPEESGDTKERTVLPNYRIVPSRSYLTAELDTPIGSDLEATKFRARTVRSTFVDGIEAIPSGSVITGTAFPGHVKNHPKCLVVEFSSLVLGGHEEVPLRASLRSVGHTNRHTEELEHLQVLPVTAPVISVSAGAISAANPRARLQTQRSLKQLAHSKPFTTGSSIIFYENADKAPEVKPGTILKLETLEDVRIPK